jgi:hypothetical protein
MTGTADTLAWEARHRPRAAIAAAFGAFAILAAALFSNLLFTDAPRSWFGEALGRAIAPGPLEDARSLQVPFYEFYDERSGLVLLGSAIRAIGWLATGWALYVLARAAMARREALPKPSSICRCSPGVISALATVAVDLSSKFAVDDFLAGPRTVASAQDVTAEGLLVLGQFLGLAGAFAAALSFGFIAFNAMSAACSRASWGVLGILVGVLLVFPIGSPIPIVQSFWLGALAVLFLDRWPGGAPPAWRTGRAEPWPTTAELREQRMAGASKPAPSRIASPPRCPPGRRLRRPLRVSANASAGPETLRPSNSHWGDAWATAPASTHGSNAAGTGDLPAAGGLPATGARDRHVGARGGRPRLRGLLGAPSRGAALA